VVAAAAPPRVKVTIRSVSSLTSSVHTAVCTSSTSPSLTKKSARSVPDEHVLVSFSSSATTVNITDFELVWFT